MTRHAGVTLPEMLVVVAVLGLAATVSLPMANPAEQGWAEAAASEIAQACRFAQAEAVNTGAWHAVSFDPAGQVVRVYRLDPTTGLEDTSQPVLHPIDRRQYRITFGAGTLRAHVDSAAFKYKGNPVSVLSFNPDGAPGIPDNGKTAELKDDGQVTLHHARAVRILTIDKATGRVVY